MNTFFISDQHFHHQAPYIRFFREDGKVLRPHGSSYAGDEAMVQNHNGKVCWNDKVYFLGDVTMGTNDKALEILGRLNGEKVLVKGNHDEAKLCKYSKYFKDVRGSCQFDGHILTHIPIHPESLSRWRANIHGHLHQKEVLGNWNKPDPRYINVSVEQPWMNYTPIAYEELKQLIKNRLELYS